MKLTNQLRSEILDVYDAFWGSLFSVDIEIYSKVLDDNYRLIGTTEKEIFFSKKEAVRFLKATAHELAGNIERRKSTVKIELVDNLVLVTDQFDAYVLIDNDWTFYGKTRVSSLMQQKNSGWKIIQQHFSFPDAKADEGQTIGLEKITKENIELRDAIKRRTIELEQKNRELEIEKSLEKVRAQALGMKKAGDLTAICEVLFSELQPLGFAELRNAMINIHDDEKKSFINYDYSDEIGKSVTHFTYDIHPLIEKQIKQVRSAVGFSETSFTGKDLKEWKIFRKKTGEKDDPRLKNVKALHYYFYSIGTGSIGISTFNAIGGEKLNILKRFRNVFDFAYRRYEDVAQAEAQTREAQIELSLERVRARSLAMHHTAELQEVIRTVHKELLHLGIAVNGGSFIAINSDIDKTLRCWGSGGTADTSAEVQLPLYEKPFCTNLINRIKNGPGFFTEEYSQREKKDFFTFLLKHAPWSKLDAEQKKETLSSPGGYIRSCCVSEHTSIFIINHYGEKFSAADNDILQRFGKVFEQTYTRFLDLQKAEAQSREAQIELGLERVRARAMAMQKSDELSELVDTVFKELTKLDFALHWCIINIIDAPALTNMVWAANPETNKPPESYLMKFEDFPFHHSMMKGYQERKIKHVYVLEGKEKKTYDDYLFNKTEWRRVPKAAQDASRAMKRYVATFTFSNFGGLQTVGEEYLSEENLDIVSRFGKVFDLTYTRFNDLQKAEAQAKEAQIEAALERVRSRSMGMQKSEELQEVIKLVYQQLTHLKINLDHAGFVVDYTAGGDWHFWIADEHDIPSKITHPYFESVWANQFNEAKEKGANFFATNLSFEEKNKFYNKLLSYVPGLPEVSKDFYLSCPGLAASTVLFDNASLYIENFLGIPYSDEANKILLRFGKVFQQTYTRFLDLQKAEAQAKESQIEAALERVRSGTMAMHKSDELLDVVKIVADQLAQLDFKFDNVSFGENNQEDDFKFWFVAAGLAQPLQIKVPYLDNPAPNRVKQAQKEGLKFFADILSMEENRQWTQQLIDNSPPETFSDKVKNFILNSAGYARSTAILKNINLYIGNYKAIPYSEEQNNLFQRFGQVFEQSYTRFLDLQKAEAQAKEAKIETSLERIRAKAMAMHHSHELDEVLEVLFDQFDILGINPMSTHMTLIDLETNTFTFRETGKGGRRSFGEQMVAIDSMDIWKQQAEKWRTSEPFSINRIHFPKESLPVVWQIFHESFAAMPDDAKLTPEDYPDGIYHTAGNCNFGYIGMNQIRKATEEEEQIVLKFATEFGRLYQRFLDLKKAEAQAREAQIEASLERVRSKTMAMHNSNDVGETAAVMVDELNKLGIKTIRCGIGIMHDPGDMEVWTIRSNENEKSDIIIGWLDMNIHPLLHGAFESWRKKNDSYSYILRDEELFNYYTAINNYPGYPIRYDTASLPKLIHHNEFYFPEGILFAFSLEDLLPEQRKIFKRFAGVFGQTYRRYLDLKKAEAQAREAQIEAALERVRSRTLAMQKSDELAETAAVLFRQLILLGIAPNRLYIGIIKDEEGHIEFWVTDEEGNKVSTQFTGNANRNSSIQKMYEAWTKQKKSLTIDMQGKELQDYFHYLSDEMNVPFKGGLEQKRRIQSIAYFAKGMIGIASPDVQPGETIILLERFAAVFNLTYTRFNDLKIAEAHAEQAELDLIKLQTEKKRAEDALTELRSTQTQLIQSEKMASLGELTAGIAHEIQNPLNFVNNFSEVSSELLDEMMEEVLKGNYDEVKSILDDVKQNLEKINHHGKRADGIVKGMLQHSRSSSGQMEPTDINVLADEYLRLAYHGLRAKDKSFNATLKTDYDETLQKANVIPQDIGRVILNLITNAFYAVGEKKKLLDNSEQLMAAAYEPTVSISTKKIAGKIEIKVTDNGNGIPQTIIDKIFQPFFTTKPTGQGTGLGLSLAYDIVKGHGGELKVETKEGDGSIFIIQLPFNHG